MQLMGIVNVTPDSFSDGGLHDTTEAAVAHGLTLARQGAAVLDVGGESTRPGAERVESGEQIRRTAAVIRSLRQALDEAEFDHVPLSIDTTRAAVAEAALDAGAAWINDISAGRDDPGMFALAAARGCPLILMHMQGQPATMQAAPHYADVLLEVCDFLTQRRDAAVAAGVAPDHILLDPGVGFGKTAEHNFSLLRGLAAVVALGHPVVLGTSRKRFLQTLVSEAEADTDRDALTALTTFWAAQQGVAYARVHALPPNRAALAWHTQLFR